MTKEERNTLNVELNNLLELKRNVICVRFIYDEEAYDNCKATEIKYKIPYCMMVRGASCGHAIKARAANMGCMGSSMALNMVDLPPIFETGELYMMFNLYHDITAAKNVSNNISILDKRPIGVEVSALDLMEENPDVIIIITNPFNAMRIVQGYSCYYGTQTNFKFAGNQAICSEATVTPYKTNDINATLMCSGTRSISCWDDDEMAIGIPFEKFANVIKGIAETADATEKNDRKEQIVRKFADTNITGPELHKNQNYHTNQYQIGRTVR